MTCSTSNGVIFDFEKGKRYQITGEINKYPSLKEGINDILRRLEGGENKIPVHIPKGINVREVSEVIDYLNTPEIE